MSRGHKGLHDGITTDEDLRNWGRKHIPGFVDVISRTSFFNLYPRMKPGQSLIINLDPNYENGGTHWTALRVSSESPTVLYKDSFGLPPPQDVTNSIHGLPVENGAPRGVIYGNRIYQKLDESNCGKRAAYWLADMARCAKKKKELECFDKYET